jgi:hypothetical protein
MKYSTILAFAAGAMAAEYYDPAYDVVSSVKSSSTPVKAIVPSTSSAADYYDYPVTSSSSSIKSSSTPVKATKPVTSSSSAAEYYDYPVSSSSSSSKKPTYTTKWVVTAYPSPCPYESTFVSASKTYTKTYTSTSTITTSSCITYYPSSSSIKSSSTPVKAIVPSTSSAADYYDYPVSSSTPVAPVKPSSTPVAPVKPSTPAAPVYPVIYGTATSAYNYAATGTGAYSKPAQFTGAATKNGAGIALAGAAIVAALF